jgi:hypothetical protein
MIVPTPLDGFQMEALDSEIVLFHPIRNIIIHSNQTGALIWQLCNGVRTIDEIIEILSAVYPESCNEIRADVRVIIETLRGQGALRLT